MSRKWLLASVMPALLIGVPLALLLISELGSLGRLELAAEQEFEQAGVRVAEELAREIRRQLSTDHVSLLYEIPIRAIQLSDLAAMRGILDDTLIPPSVLGTFFVGLGDDRDTAVASWPQESSILFYRHPLTGAVPTSGGCPTVR